MLRVLLGCLTDSAASVIFFIKADLSLSIISGWASLNYSLSRGLDFVFVNLGETGFVVETYAFFCYNSSSNLRCMALNISAVLG